MGAPDERAAAEASAPRFAAYFRVRHYEADAVGHVNNAAYLHYLEQAAIEHSAAVGYPLGRYREMGTLFIVRRHEVDYLRPVSPGDVLGNLPPSSAVANIVSPGRRIGPAPTRSAAPGPVRRRSKPFDVLLGEISSTQAGWN
ncbi:MAG: acyl-CoA thioesterase [Actinomycetota bacterium]|nr:acyl-CoA thioesterase [Actinomycetota bacterium]MDQ5809762.1 acyl-CoA thioesterase [Actinomycetota bacterium]